MTAAASLFLLTIGLSIGAPTLLGHPSGYTQACTPCDPVAPTSATPSAQPTDPLTANGAGTLIAHIRVAGQRGVARADDRPTGPVDIGPAAGVAVQVELSGQPGPVMQAVADADGTVQAELPSATYWVFVPLTSDVAGLPGAQPAGANLPDGRPVAAWAEAVVPSGGSAEVTLVIAVALP